MHRPGIGVLVRRGTFWYPGRLTDCPGENEESYDLYTVRMWRDCEYDEEARALTPGETVEARLTDIVDCLWDCRKERRLIRVRVAHENYLNRCLNP